MTNVTELKPTWPEVRCDGCKQTYTYPDHEKDGLIVGDCPHCGHDKFSTIIKSSLRPR